MYLLACIESATLKKKKKSCSKIDITIFQYAVLSAFTELFREPDAFDRDRGINIVSLNPKVTF